MFVCGFHRKCCPHPLERRLFSCLQFVCPSYSCLLTLLTVAILLAGCTEDVFLGTMRSGRETDYSPIQCRGMELHRRPLFVFLSRTRIALLYLLPTLHIFGWYSSVGIATRYGLDGPWIESRWGATFSAPVQTGPEAHPAPYTMGTGSFSG